MENEVKEYKNNGKGLLIAGIIFLVPAVILTFLFTWSFVEALLAESLSKAIVLVIALVYYLIPGAILGIVSLIINIFSFMKAPVETKKLRMIPLVISIIALFLLAGEYIYLSVAA